MSVLLAHGRLNEFASASSHDANNECQFLLAHGRLNEFASAKVQKTFEPTKYFSTFFENIYKEDAKGIPKIAEDRTFSSFGVSKKFKKKTQSRRKRTVRKRKKASKRGFFFTLNRKSIAFSP